MNQQEALDMLSSKMGEHLGDGVFVTDNLKLAMALTAAGFSIRHGEQATDINGRSLVVCELDSAHNGVKANYLKLGFENQVDLVTRVNEIIETRGITQEEYVVLAFDAARAGLHNRSTVLFAIRNNKPLIAKEIGDGRSLIYREGTPKSHIKKLIENA